MPPTNPFEADMASDGQQQVSVEVYVTDVPCVFCCRMSVIDFSLFKYSTFETFEKFGDCLNLNYLTKYNKHGAVAAAWHLRNRHAY
jgi:hypothetical protein